MNRESPIEQWRLYRFFCLVLAVASGFALIFFDTATILASSTFILLAHIISFLGLIGFGVATLILGRKIRRFAKPPEGSSS